MTARVSAIYLDGTYVLKASASDDVVIVLDHAVLRREPVARAGDGERARSRVLVDDTIKVQASVFGHHGRIVEARSRSVTRSPHASTASAVRRRCATTRPRLMHKALRKVLGAHVQPRRARWSTPSTPSTSRTARR